MNIQKVKDYFITVKRERERELQRGQKITEEERNFINIQGVNHSRREEGNLFRKSSRNSIS